MINYTALKSRINKINNNSIYGSLSYPHPQSFYYDMYVYDKNIEFDVFMTKYLSTNITNNQFRNIHNIIDNANNFINLILGYNKHSKYSIYIIPVIEPINDYNRPNIKASDILDGSFYIGVELIINNKSYTSKFIYDEKTYILDCIDKLNNMFYKYINSNNLNIDNIFMKYKMSLMTSYDIMII